MKLVLSIVVIFTFTFLSILAASTVHAAASFDFSCETPVTANEQFDGEVKYSCIVENTGDSYLQLRYEVQPENNPINPGLAVGFHPQPSRIFLEAGEKQPIVGFEVPPKPSSGQNEISYGRTITVRPEAESEGKVQPKQATITTIVKSQPLNDDAKILGKVLDAQTEQPIANAEILLKYKRFEERLRTSPSGDYSSDLPSLQYIMTVQAKGYKLFSKEINLKSGEELKMDASLSRAEEKGSYDLVKEVKLESGSWEGVWRSVASSDGKYFAFGIGGDHANSENLESYFYLFDNSGQEILKTKTADEIRGIDISPDGSLIAIGLGYSQIGNSNAPQYEKVMLFKKNGELVWKKYVKDNAFHEIRFSHDGKYVAAGDAEGYIYLLNAVDGGEIWKKFTRGQVRAIKFYDDDSHMLVGNGEGYIYLFDIDGNSKWKTYVHSWPYGFIATTPGNDFSAAGGHMGYLHLLDKNGKDLWAYEAEGGFRWAEIGPDASFVVGGTRSELAFLDSQGKVLWKGYDSVSGAITKDKKYIISANQKAELELRDESGTILWEHRTGQMEPGKDVRFSYISDDAALIVGAVKTGEVYFYKGSIFKADVNDIYAGENTGTQNSQPPYQELPPMRPTQKSKLSWIIFPVIVIALLVIIVLYIKKKK